MCSPKSSCSLSGKLFALLFAFMFLPTVVGEQKVWHSDPPSTIPPWSLRVYNMSKDDFHACYKLNESETICANSSEKHVQISNGDGEVFFDIRDTPNYEYRRIGNISLVKFKGEIKERQLLANNLIFDSREEVPDSYLTDIDENEFKEQAKELMMRGNVDAMVPLADSIDELSFDEGQRKAARPVLTLAMNVLNAEAKGKASGELIMGKSKYHDQRIRREKRFIFCSVGRRPRHPDCLGMCGPGCWCWWQVCGDCCIHKGCYEHDLCCRHHFFSSGCIGPLNLVLRFRCSGYPNCGRVFKKKSCFPADAIVRGKDSQTIFLKDLQVGDEVLTTSGESGEPVFTKVIAFLHRDPQSTHTYLRLQFVDGDSLTVSKRHLIFKKENGDSQTAVFAENLAVGDRLFKYSKNGNSILASQVLAIQEIQARGFYAPLTEHGTILINDVLASCYAEIRSHRLAHFAFAPLRVWKSWFPGKKSQKGVHSYAIHLQNGVQWFKPFFPQPIAEIFESV